MRILVTGSRSWRCPELAEQIINRLLARYGLGLVIVHGAASGVDASFAEAADELGVEHEPHPAHWGELHAPGAIIRRDKNGHPYNANAGPSRNRIMVASRAAFCLAVHQDIGSSKGTKDCVRQALAAGMPVWLVESDEGEVVRLRSDDRRLS